MENPIESATGKDEIVWNANSKKLEKRTNFTVNLKSPYKEILAVVGIILGLLLIGWMVFVAK